MKKMKSIYALVAGTMLLASCAENEHPTFNDADAFAAFTTASFSVNENVEGGELQIPVLFTSLAGLEKSVDFEIVDGTAALGVDFELVNSSNTLNFTKEAPTQYITIKIIDNDNFGGDINFSVTLKESEGINLGAANACSVKIIDNEHPLAFILGDYTATGTSVFYGDYSWDVTISKDADDVSKVWIGNLDPYFASYGYVSSKGYNNFYGIVNDEKTVISVAQEQAIGYEDCKLYGFAGTDPNEVDVMDSGENITISISTDGSVLIVNEAYGINYDGWWNVMYGGVKLTKK